MEKNNQLLNNVIECMKPLIGYAYCPDIQDILYKVVSFIGKALNSSTKEIEEVNTLLQKCYSIHKYSDYLLISNEKYGVPMMDFDRCKKYFHYLELKKDKEYIFDEEEFKKELDQKAILGDFDAVRLKAYLFAVQACGYSSKSSAIKLLKETLYFGDLVALKILKKLDTKNRKYYEEFYCCLSDLFRDASLDFKNMTYSKSIIDASKIYVKCYRILKEKGCIDHPLLNYIFTTNDDVMKQLKHIEYQLYDTSNYGQMYKLGFKVGE